MPSYHITCKKNCILEKSMCICIHRKTTGKETHQNDHTGESLGNEN